MMEIIVQWATILSPIIAVLIAVWVNQKNAKDTKKQLDGLKNLCIMQISNTLDMLEMELYKYSLGKEEDASELHALREEMNLLRQEENPDTKEIARLENKIEKIGKNVQYKNSFTWKIMMRQFELIRGMNNVKKM
jgi:predicted  nucleic acid-binding Zn-ribbon protein